MFFLLGDDGGFCYETFGALAKALKQYRVLLIEGGLNHTLSIEK